MGHSSQLSGQSVKSDMVLFAKFVGCQESTIANLNILYFTYLLSRSESHLEFSVQP